MRSLAPSNGTGVLSKGTDVHRGMISWGHGAKVAVYTPGVASAPNQDG